MSPSTKNSTSTDDIAISKKSTSTHVIVLIIRAGLLLILSLHHHLRPLWISITQSKVLHGRCWCANLAVVLLCRLENRGQTSIVRGSKAVRGVPRTGNIVIAQKHLGFQLLWEVLTNYVHNGPVWNPHLVLLWQSKHALYEFSIYSSIVDVFSRRFVLLLLFYCYFVIVSFLCGVSISTNNSLLRLQINDVVTWIFISKTSI